MNTNLDEGVSKATVRVPFGVLGEILDEIVSARAKYDALPVMELMCPNCHHGSHSMVVENVPSLPTVRCIQCGAEYRLHCSFSG